MLPSVEYSEMKLQLDVPTTWTVETLADGQRRYVVPGSATPAPDLVVLVRDSLPLPLDRTGWPLAALMRLKTSLLAALPGELAAVGLAAEAAGAAGTAAARWRIQLQSSAALTTASSWPATIAHATLLDETKPSAGQSGGGALPLPHLRSGGDRRGDRSGPLRRHA